MNHLSLINDSAGLRLGLRLGSLVEVGIADRAKHNDHLRSFETQIEVGIADHVLQ